MVLSNVVLILNGVLNGVRFSVLRCSDIVGGGDGRMSDVCWSCAVDLFLCILLITGVKPQTIMLSQGDSPIRQIK
jgi:hypothetical protein